MDDSVDFLNLPSNNKLLNQLANQCLCLCTFFTRSIRREGRWYSRQFAVKLAPQRLLCAMLKQIDIVDSVSTMVSTKYKRVTCTNIGGSVIPKLRRGISSARQTLPRPGLCMENMHILRFEDLIVKAYIHRYPIFVTHTVRPPISKRKSSSSTEKLENVADSGRSSAGVFCIEDTMDQSQVVKSRT